MLALPNVLEITRERATALVFEDQKSQALLERIERLAPSDVGVLIMGETGTGKELVARHIHDKSHRRPGPFVAVNCGALMESLFESELFGYEKGAFTGAQSARKGWFEAADGGTLFLDEIGDLPFSMQVKLLRVLQEREVVRLGARAAIPVNVRVLAATNVNLADAVKAGHFREDLFYRLHVATVYLPPLRQRAGDIIPLARYFVEKYCLRLGYPSISISACGEEKLMSHSWPGNARELENAIHYALIICRDNQVRAKDLQLLSLTLSSDYEPVSANIDSPVEALERAFESLFDGAPPELYALVEDTLIRTAYRFCHENQVQSARLLGISRNVMRARLLRIGEIKNHRAVER
nr:sigma-54 dependent transcriptional regulator [Ectothiorhodospira lacustris]